MAKGAYGVPRPVEVIVNTVETKIQQSHFDNSFLKELIDMASFNNKC